MKTKTAEQKQNRGLRIITPRSTKRVQHKCQISKVSPK